MPTYLVHFIDSGLPVQISTGADTADVLAGFGPEYGAVVVGAGVTDSTHYVTEQGDLEPFPSPGKPWERFDRISRLWIDTRTLIRLKADKWAEIKKVASQANKANLLVLSKPFQTDSSSLEALYRAAQLAVMNQVDGQSYTVDWTLADNTIQTLTLAQIKGVIRAIDARTAANRSKATDLRVQIANAINSSAVSAITW